MSMMLCDQCDAPIDTDEDMDCFIEAPSCAPARFRQVLEEILCERCRERRWEREQERRAEDAP